MPDAKAGFRKSVIVRDPDGHAGEVDLPGTFVDSSVLLDVFTEDDRWLEWSQRELTTAALTGPLIINAVVLAESPMPHYEFMGRGAAPKELADWRGKRARVPGGLGRAMERLGAVPTTVPESVRTVSSAA